MYSRCSYPHQNGVCVPAAVGRSLVLQRPPSSIILGTRGLESICTWAVPSPWGTFCAPPMYEWIRYLIALSCPKAGTHEREGKEEYFVVGAYLPGG